MLHACVGDTTMYRLCGDNVDKGVKQRYMRVYVNKPDSIHYFHAYTVSGQIDFSNLSEEIIATTTSKNRKQIAA